MLLLITTLSLTFSSCGGDDDDEPKIPTDSNKEILQGTLGSGNNLPLVGKPAFNSVGVALQAFGSYLDFYISGYYTAKMNYVGEVTKLSEISGIPASGWEDRLELKDGGYVFSISSTADATEVIFRALIKKLYSVSGDYIGIEYQIQKFH